MGDGNLCLSTRMLLPWLLLCSAAFGTQNAVLVVGTDTAPEIDGSLNERMWKDACTIRRFVQLMPEKGAMASESTTVYLVADAGHLYIGVRCFDDPTEIRANATIRDHPSVGWDDGVSLFLDPYNDKTSGYAFGLNVLGTQMDCRIAEDGNLLDREWDGQWESSTSVTDLGWEAEIAIPFSTLRFDPGNPVWGFNVVRGIARKLEAASWVEVTNQLRVSEWGEIQGFSFAKRRVYRTRATPYFSLMHPKQADVSMTVGINRIQWQVTGKLLFEFTVKPDYAHLEADADEFDLDKLPQYLPEKRPFFLEERSLLETPLDLVYTRSISDIAAGAKFIGSLPHMHFHCLGVIKTIDRRESVWCLRLIRNMGRPTRIGFLLMQSRGLSGTNQAFSVDGLIKLPKQLYASGQFAESQTPCGNAWLFSLSRFVEPDGLSFEIQPSTISPHFLVETAYLPFADLVETSVFLSPAYTLNWMVVKNVALSASYLHRETHEGMFMCDRISLGGSVRLHHNSDLTYTISNSTQLCGGSYCHNSVHSVAWEYTPGGWSGIQILHTFGHLFGAGLSHPSVTARVAVGRMNMALSLQRQNLSYKHCTECRYLATFKSNYALTKSLNLRTFFEWSHISHEMNVNFLFQYDIWKGSHAYLAWNERQEISDSEVWQLNPVVKDRMIMLKLSFDLDR